MNKQNDKRLKGVGGAIGNSPKKRTRKHPWRGVDVKVSLLRGTGLVLPSVSDPLIIMHVGSFSSLCNILDKL